MASFKTKSVYISSVIILFGVYDRRCYVLYNVHFFQKFLNILFIFDIINIEEF